MIRGRLWRDQGRLPSRSTPAPPLTPAGGFGEYSFWIKTLAAPSPPTPAPGIHSHEH